MNLGVIVSRMDRKDDLLTFAFGLGQAIGSGLHFYHCIDLREDGELQKINQSDLLTRAEKKETLIGSREEEIAYRVISGVSKEYNDIQVSFHVEIGSLGDHSLLWALEYDMDLLIIGPIGSTSSQVLKSELNILIDSSLPLLVFGENVKYQFIETIVYATNFVYEDLKAMRFVTRLLDRFQAKLTLLHVSSSDREQDESALRLQYLKEVFDDYAIRLVNMKGNLKGA